MGIFEPEKALLFIQEYIRKTYGKKGEAVVKINCECAKAGMKYLEKVQIPESWGNLKEESADKTYEFKNDKIKDFVLNIALPISKMEGNNLPVSAFSKYADGSVLPGSAAYEKRNTASFVPSWKPENCIECNLCSYVCPHAVIRPKALTEKEILDAPFNIKH